MILSGHQRFDYAQKALKLHCASYVLKPIDKTQLCDEIRHALELKQNQSHQESAASISSIAPAKTAQDQLAEDEDFIFRVRTYIYSNLSDPDLNRSSIAEYLHMSPDYWIIYLMYFIRNLTRLLVLTLHPCTLIRQMSFLKEPTGEWILLQKKLDFPAAPTFINNSKK